MGHLSIREIHERLNELEGWEMHGNEIVKEFKKTNVERHGAIMKNANLKPDELAKMIGHDLLNSRTRKQFYDSMIVQESNRNSASKTTRIRKKNVALAKFF